MTLEVIPLAEEDLEDAATLACHRYRECRAQLPLLPPQYGEVDTLLPLLQKLLAAGPGVAAIHRDRLVGFIAAWLLPSFRGRPAVLSPEWGNAAQTENRRRIYEEMYTHLSSLWVESGYLVHMIGALADNSDGTDIWHWLGFGMTAADALRGLEPADGPTAKVEIRRAGLDDIDMAMTFVEALHRHAASAPTFLIQTVTRDRRYYEEWLANPANAFWLAYDGSTPVAFMKHGPASLDTCTIIRDAKTTSITGAYTREDLRCHGVATALLNHSLEWARNEGYECCAVDFEPMNPPATRFWLRHFLPVCYTLVRHVDKPKP